VGGEPLPLSCVLILQIRVLMDFAGPIGARELAVLVSQARQHRRRQQADIIEKQGCLSAGIGRKIWNATMCERSMAVP